MPERKERSRLLILSTLCQFSLSRTYDGDTRTHGGMGEHSFRGTRTPDSGALVALNSAPHSKWYLSWVRSFSKPEGYADIVYVLESIEDGEICDWSNVSLSQLPYKTTQEHPEWRWTDAQHEFNDRWRAVCFKEKDAYIVLPTAPEFADEGYGVTLGTRTRFGWDDFRPSKEFKDWRKVTKKMMGEWYDEAVAMRDALPKPQPPTQPNATT